ncbi:MAG: hypothetical protein AAGE93_24695 [Bacteroidota bacterium]
MQSNHSSVIIHPSLPSIVSLVYNKQRWHQRIAPLFVNLGKIYTMQLLHNHFRTRKPTYQPAVSRLATATIAISVGAMAVGALAIGTVAIGSLALAKARIKSLKIDDLSVERLRVKKLIVDEGLPRPEA